MLLLVWPVIAAAVGSLVTYEYLSRQTTLQIAQRPPVVVIDTASYVADAGNDVAAGVATASAVAQQYAREGYVVLDSPSVLQAPDALVVRSGAGQ